MLTNFGAGPATLPAEVMEKASQSILEFKNSGLSILEIPHRGKLFLEILEEANDLVNKILNLGNDYIPLWIQGGGRMQFAMIPMNFLKMDQTAGYIDSGHWASDAAACASYYGKINILASSKNSNYAYIPECDPIPDDLAYLHLTSNNTIYGTQYFKFPDTEVPLVADMSSELFSRNINYRQFDMIYAVAQKNIGVAGVTLAVIKKDFLDKANPNLPGILSYQEIAKKNSIVNTPPVFAIYCSLLMLQYIDAIGLEKIEQENIQKAGLLYNFIDNSSLFYGIAKEDRSLMNVCFDMFDNSKQQTFIDYATERNITGIKGHRSVKGFRVSLYNAIRIGDVQQLVNCMEEFEQKFG